MNDASCAFAFVVGSFCEAVGQNRRFRSLVVSERFSCFLTFVAFACLFDHIASQ